MQQTSLMLNAEGKSVGFVPTMGFLHEGHLSLIRRSREENNITVVSIFVNPAQFAPSEDFSKYPRDVDRDIKSLLQEGVDILFMPDAEEIYPQGYQTYISVNEITKKQEGEFRPEHFNGVTTIVGMLFNIVIPARAYFGQKDAQQAAVIKRMVKDLKYNIEIIICPIVRDPDGLAMSSRNVYLSPEERKKALLLSHSLKEAEGLIKEGETDAQAVIKKINRNFLGEKTIQMNYIRIVDADTFMEVDSMIKGRTYYILIACKIGRTRLIDNISIRII